MEKGNVDGFLGSGDPESRGTPAVEHKKKRARAESNIKKERALNQEKFYTVRNKKILLFTVKSNGAYSSYVDKYKPVGTPAVDPFIKKLKAENKYVDDLSVSEKCREIIDRLVKAEEKLKKAK